MEAPPATVPLFIDCHRLDLDAALPEHAERCLSPEERQRAARFRFEHLQRHYRACRIGLRHLLGRRLGIDPADIGFEQGPYGKPRLAARHGSGLHFNLSHSGSVAWIALADAPVGIDLEQTDRSLPDRSALSRRVASIAEQAAMQAMPVEQRTDIFLLAWTRKEALLKAWGRGIGGLDSLQSLDTRLPAPEALHTFLHTGSNLPEPATIDSMARLSAVEIRLPPVNAPSAHTVGNEWAEEAAPPPVFWLNSFHQGHEILSLAAPQPFQVLVRPQTGAMVSDTSPRSPLDNRLPGAEGDSVARI